MTLLWSCTLQLWSSEQFSSLRVAAFCLLDNHMSLAALSYASPWMFDNCSCGLLRVAINLSF